MLYKDNRLFLKISELYLDFTSFKAFLEKFLNYFFLKNTFKFLSNLLKLFKDKTYPALKDLISSDIPTWSETITGTPNDKASRTDIPKFSCLDNKIKISAFLNKLSFFFHLHDHAILYCH